MSTYVSLLLICSNIMGMLTDYSYVATAHVYWNDLVMNAWHCGANLMSPVYNIAFIPSCCM